MIKSVNEYWTITNANTGTVINAISDVINVVTLASLAATAGTVNIAKITITLIVIGTVIIAKSLTIAVNTAWK